MTGIFIPKGPLYLRWRSADVPDGGVICIVDSDGYDIAYMESKKYKWRSGDVGQRLQFLCDAWNRYQLHK